MIHAIGLWLSGRHAKSKRVLLELLVLFVGAVLVHQLSRVLGVPSTLVQWLSGNSVGLADLIAPALFLMVSLPVWGLRVWLSLRSEIKLADTDALTNLNNRRKFYELLQLEIRRARRFGRELGVVVFDVDGLKFVNDTYGHDVGDYALRVVADLANKTIRTTDYIARWGGDEFVIIAPETNLAGATKLSEKLAAAIKQHRFQIFHRLTVCVGIACMVKDDDPDALFERADAMLREQKSQRPTSRPKGIALTL